MGCSLFTEAYTQRISEFSTSEWARNISGIDELLGTDFSDLSHNALYRISDLLYENKKEIENHLNI